MSAIFLSHSSADAAAASEWKRWLADEQHHQSVFLDFDPAQGIPAGRDWEGELYRRLRNCRALIVLCSPSSMASRWCFVEIALARSLGKPVFPIRIEPCEVVDILSSVQIVDVAEGLEVARERLGRALGSAGLQSADRFGWDRAASRSPYPGLLAFDEADAGVFFGRDFEIGEGLDRLNQMRRYRGGGLLVVLGAAGSGKSSLVRAGLVPRLRQDRKWIVLPPFRPGNEPLHQLAKAMAEAAPRGSSFTAEAFEQVMSADTSVEDAAAALNRAMGEVCGCAPDPEARLLVVLDQFEELLGHREEHPAHRFLAILRQALDRDDCVMVVLATMRSDYLGEFQSRPALRGFAYENLTVGPMSLENLRELIERPAQLAEVQLEDTLIDALLRDADTDYALPLLAFTLHELYTSHRDARGTITREAYEEQLGGLEGALTKAVERRLPAVVSEEDREALRKAFLAMARLDDDGRITRRAVRWSELETLMGGRQKAEALLGPFLEGRLLRDGGIEQGERTVEVTHEALFRNWPDLVRWIHEHLGDLKFRDHVAEAAAHWVKGGEKDVDLQRHPVRLARAIEMRDAGRVPMSDELKRFIAVSEAFDRRRRAAIARRRRLIVGGALGAALFMAVMALLAVAARRDAQRSAAEARKQVSRFLAAETGRQDLDVALLLGIEAHRAADTLEARDALVGKVFESPELARFLVGHEDWVTTLVGFDERPLLVSRGKDGQVVFWDAETGRLLHRLASEGRSVGQIALDGVGRRLATAHDDGSITLWDLAPGTAAASPRRGIRVPGDVGSAMALSPDGTLLAAVDREGSVHLWTAADGAELALIRADRTAGRDGELVAMAFDPSGEWLATGREDGLVQVWGDLRGEPAPIWEYRADGDPGAARAIAFADGTARSWAWAYRANSYVHVCAAGAEAGDGPCPEGPEKLAGPALGVGGLSFGPEGQLAVGGLDGSIRIWRLSEPTDGRPVLSFAEPRAIDAVAFAGTHRLVTGSRDGKIRSWRLDPSPMGHPYPDFVDALAVGSSGDDPTVLAVVGETLSLWRQATPAEEVSVPTGPYSRLALAHGVVAVGGEDGAVGVWSEDLSDRLGGLETEQVVMALAVHPQLDQVAVGLEDGTVGLWKIGSPGFQYSFVLPDTVSAVAFSGDGSRLAAGSFDGSLVLWEIADGAPRSETRDSAEAGITCLLFERAGTALLVGLDSGAVARWDESGELSPIEGHPTHGDPVSSLAIDAKGRLLASGSSVLEVWNLSQSRPELSLKLPGPEGEIASLGFTPDGGTILAALGETVWRVPLDVDRWIEAACARANRDLNDKEWAEHLGERRWRPTCDLAEKTPDQGRASAERGDGQ